MALGKLVRDFTSTPTNADKFTISFWIKYVYIKSGMVVVSNVNTGGSGSWVELRSDMSIGFIQWQSDTSTVWNLESSKSLLDTSSWYHVVIAGDSTQGTAADRLKMYINGVEEPSYQASTYAAQNTDFRWNKEQDYGTKIGHQVGRATADGSNFRGYLAHIHNIDGTAYAASTFGETDSTTGIWKPKLNPSVTYGTNGWFLKMENSGAMGTDSSGNGNNFTVSGDVKQSKTTPSDDFCVLNYNECYYNERDNAMKYGNTQWKDAQYSQDGAKGAVGTLATAKGKWYFEVKHVEGMYSTAGISKSGTKAVAQMITTTYKTPFYAGNEGDGFGFQMGTQPTLIQRGDSTEAQWYQSDGSTNITSFSNGDICMIAYDLDAGKIWWGKNGTWLDAPGTSNTGNPATGANAHKTWTANGEFFRPAVSCYQRTYGGGAGANPNTVYCNFGEGRFANTAVSSGNADGAGKGSFEYAPPSGFYALCSSNIKNYG